MRLLEQLSDERNVMRYILLFILYSGFVLAETDYIPKQAFQYFPLISSEASRLMPELKYKHYIPSLIEHESCISLKHKRCWNPSSELKTNRERGIGLPQLTIAYNKDGSVRFDKLTELAQAHKQELKELSWLNVISRPDLQIRALILLVKENYSKLQGVKNSYQRLKMSDAAYNGGYGGLNNERIACGLAKNCDPQIWDNNVEKYCLKSKKILYGNRSACTINRNHVFLVFENMKKYKEHF